MGISFPSSPHTKTYDIVKCSISFVSTAPWIYHGSVLPSLFCNDTCCRVWDEKTDSELYNPVLTSGSWRISHHLGKYYSAATGV